MKHRSSIVLVFSVASIVLLSSASAWGGISFVDVASIEPVGLVEGAGYLLIPLPAANTLGDARVHEVFLELELGNADLGDVVEAIPFDTGSDVIPAEGIARDSTRARFVGRCPANRRQGGIFRISIGLRALWQAIRDESYTADSILLGLSAGEGPSGRWPAAAIESVTDDPSGWRGRFRFYTADR